MVLGPTYSNNPDCSCMGHRVPGVKHIVACCGKPHVDDFDGMPMITKTTRRMPPPIQFPHCDARVLHAPGVCEFCDRHPDWQRLRETWKINFTGCYIPDHQPCPAEQARSLDKIHAWQGNRPETDETKAAREVYYRELERRVERLLQEQREQASLDSCEGIDSRKTR